MTNFVVGVTLFCKRILFFAENVSAIPNEMTNFAVDFIISAKTLDMYKNKQE